MPFLYPFQSLSQKWSVKVLALLKEAWSGFNPVRILQFGWLWIFLPWENKARRLGDKPTQQTTEHGSGPCPLVQVGLTRTINDLHVDLIQKKKKIEGKGKCHNINPVLGQQWHSSAEGNQIVKDKGPSSSAELQIFRFQLQTFPQMLAFPHFH